MKERKIVMAAEEMIGELFSTAFRFDDVEAVANENAESMNAAFVRPAFFDVSSVMYRFLYAKADEYCRMAGDSDTLLVCYVCCDIISDISDACSTLGCAPILCFDSVHSFRKEIIFPEYKSGRRSSLKTEQIERVLSLRGNVVTMLRTYFCPAMKLQYFCLWGYESDDIIAWFVRSLKEPRDVLGTCPFKESVVIVSSDHDLHQLIFDDVYLGDVSTGILCSSAMIEKHTGIHPRDVVAAKCVGGCASDAIPGVPGCGEKTVMQFLSSRNFDVKLKKARENLNSFDGERILRRNLKLIRLPLCVPELDLVVPHMRINKRVWPNKGIPDVLAKHLVDIGVREERLPYFGDVRKPKSQSVIPTCEWRKKESNEQ